MQRPEQKLQQAVTQALDRLLIPPAMFLPIPNGGQRSKTEAAIMKAHGMVKAGVADLMVVWPVALGVDVLWIELKAGKGRQSPDQLAFADQATRAGCGYVVCRSVDEVLEGLTQRRCPLRKAALF